MFYLMCMGHECFCEVGVQMHLKVVKREQMLEVKRQGEEACKSVDRTFTFQMALQLSALEFKFTLEVECSLSELSFKSCDSQGGKIYVNGLEANKFFPGKRKQKSFQ